jgi:hypothetical protein
MLKLRNPQSLPAMPGVGLAMVTPVIDIVASGNERKIEFVRKFAAGVRRSMFRSFDEGSGRAYSARRRRDVMCELEMSEA